MKKNFIQLGIQFLLIVSCICSFSLLYSQNQINGTIRDAETNDVIPFANILNLNDEKGSVSDQNGMFQIIVDRLPTRLQFSFIGYKTDTILVDNLENQEIFLRKDNQNLPLVEISANQKLEAVESSGFLPRNFVVWKDHIFLLSKNVLLENIKLKPIILRVIW